LFERLIKSLSQCIGELLLKLPDIIELGTETALGIRVELTNQLLGFLLKAIL